MRNLLKVSLLAAGLCSVAPALAGAQVYVHVGPPRPLVERRPIAPGAGYAWRGGYNRWDGNRYVWVPGEYLAPPRPHAFYVQGRWAHSPRGYYWREGYWR